MKDRFGIRIMDEEKCWYNNESDEYLSQESAWKLYSDLGVTAHKKIALYLNDDEIIRFSELWDDDEVDVDGLMDYIGFEEAYYYAPEEYNPYEIDCIYDL